MTNIKPKIVDGEPFCTWIECPSFGIPGSPSRCEHVPGLGAYVVEGDPCIPGLRAQRDEALDERDAARRKLCFSDAYNRGVAREVVAQEHGWSYLYEEVER